MKIEIGKFNIGYIGSNFQEHFGSQNIKPKKCKLESRVLEKNMDDKAILAELKPQEVTLNEFIYTLERDKNLLKNGYNNIFYIRDGKNTLWAVIAGWDSDDRVWFVDAVSVTSPREWCAGYRVLSQSFSSGT